MQCDMIFVKKRDIYYVMLFIILWCVSKTPQKQMGKGLRSEGHLV